MLELEVLDGETTVVLRLEHSLRSVSKWESKHVKAFLETPVKENEQMIDYFQCMLLEGQDPNLIYRLSPDQQEEIVKYINTPQTASSVPEHGNKSPSREKVTSELIYYWMTGLKINWEAQDWHLSRLMMLINITNFKMQPEKKQDKAKMLDRFRAQSQLVKEKYGSSG